MCSLDSSFPRFATVPRPRIKVTNIFLLCPDFTSQILEFLTLFLTLLSPDAAITVTHIWFIVVSNITIFGLTSITWLVYILKCYSLFAQLVSVIFSATWSHLCLVYASSNFFQIFQCSFVFVDSSFGRFTQLNWRFESYWPDNMKRAVERQGLSDVNDQPPKTQRKGDCHIVARCREWFVWGIHNELL